MKQNIMLFTAGLVIVVATYFVGARSANADAVCYLKVPQVGCSGCQSTPCSGCQLGDCSGTTKVCNETYTWQEYVGSSTADYKLQSVDEFCFNTYSCVPRDGGDCGPNNPCVAGGAAQPSATHFSKPQFAWGCKVGNPIE